MTVVIEAQGLSKSFGRKMAVSGVSFTVEESSVFALLGPNGCGKTTTIKMLMNILEPSEGRSSIFGTDSRRLGPDQFRQIGYVSENQRFPEWMTVAQLLSYCRPMYPSWDQGFCDHLLAQLGLPLDQKLKRLSRGMKVKAFLLSSLAYRPRLLMLDEPFSGLDPLVREEFVRGVLELAAQERWTIFVSSHDIEEVERLADWVGFLDDGRLELVERLDSLQYRFRRVEVTLGAGAVVPSSLPPSWLTPEHAGHRLTFVESAYQVEVSEIRAREYLRDCQEVVAHPMSLREIFLALTRGYRLGGQAR